MIRLPIVETNELFLNSPITSIIPPPYVSASLIGAFESCPRKFAVGHFFNDKGSNENALFGTNFHNFVDQIDGLTDKEARKLCEELFGEDFDFVWDTVCDIRNKDQVLGYKPLGRETKFEIFVPEIGITIVGHIDYLLESSDGKTLIIRDWKTGFHYEPSVVWSNRIQPRVYNWAVRALAEQGHLKTYENYVFQIWYPRLDRKAEWNLEPENAAFLNYISHVWADLKRYFAKGWINGDPASGFPEILGESCKYCHLRPKCSTYQRVLQQSEVPEWQSNETAADRFVRLEAMKKAVESAINEVKEEIAEMFEPDQKELILAGHTFRMISRKTKEWKFDDVFELVKLINFDFNKLFKVASTGMRSLAEEHPELDSTIYDLATIKESKKFLSYASNSRRTKTSGVDGKEDDLE